MSSLAALGALVALMQALGGDASTTMEPSEYRFSSTTGPPHEHPAEPSSEATTDIISQLKINDALARTVRQKRNMNGKRNKWKNPRNDPKSVQITKYDRKGVVFALRVSETTTPSAKHAFKLNPRPNETRSAVENQKCNIYTVKKTILCDSPEGELFSKSLGVEKYRRKGAKGALPQRRSSKHSKS